MLGFSRIWGILLSGEGFLTRYPGKQEMTVLVAGERFVGINTTVGLEPVGMVQESTRYLVKVFFQSARLIRPGTSCTVEFP